MSETTTNTPQAASMTGMSTATSAPFAVVLLLVLVIMLPIEINFSLGGLFLTPAKVFLVIMTFVVVPKAMGMRLKIFDWLFLAHVVWSALCFALIWGLGLGASEQSKTRALQRDAARCRLRHSPPTPTLITHAS